MHNLVLVGRKKKKEKGKKYEKLLKLTLKAEHLICCVLFQLSSPNISFRLLISLFRARLGGVCYFSDLNFLWV